MASIYMGLADAVLILHFVFVFFVITGFLLILLGAWKGWNWVRNSWFRVSHLLSIGYVALISWLGLVCPLTTLEKWLRDRAGGDVYEGSFIQYWLEQILYYDAPTWVFVVAYSLFALMVLAAMFAFPPDFTGSRKGNDV